jgi:hypothetical protein
MGAFKEMMIDEVNAADLPSQIRAVLLIFEADGELRAKALPYVDIENEVVDWDGIYENDFDGGLWAALTWAKAIYCDQVSTTSDPFDRAFAMDQKLQVAVLRALATRWGLSA